MTMTTFVLPLVGGILIGLASVMLLAFNGRIAGISGILNGILTPKRGEVLWRALFIAGLIVGGIAVGVVYPGAFPEDLNISYVGLAVAGLLVGFGTRLGSGCTSGHGVCGMSRLSGRSIIATLTFMATGAAAVLIVRYVFGGAV